jgi:SPASM domain peptide maturase of grasp-with-spasm system
MNSNRSEVLRLYENCIITKGASRSLICDHQGREYYHIPNALANMFVENVLDVDAVNIEDEDKETFQEYVNFLLDNELCFYLDRSMLENFPRIDYNEWDSYSAITNAIIETHNDDFSKYIAVIEELSEKYNCHQFELCIYGALSIEDLTSILRKIKEIDLDNLNLIFALKEDVLVENARQVLDNEPRLFRAIIYANPTFDEVHSTKILGGTLFILPDDFTYDRCGKVNPLYFTNNIEHVTESHGHNTCLNRKLSIDTKGNIKNCPNMPTVYGNVFESSLAQILQHPDFKQYWFIKKDSIRICKDCEYRHICTDCRAFIENPQDILSKPLKCGYDPYTNVWTDKEKELAMKVL